MTTAIDDLYEKIEVTRAALEKELEDAITHRDMANERVRRARASLDALPRRPIRRTPKVLPQDSEGVDHAER